MTLDQTKLAAAQFKYGKKWLDDTKQHQIPTVCVSLAIRRVRHT